MPEKHTKDYYTTIEAAKLLGVSVRTVQLWVESGELEAWKTAGGHRRIVVSSVDKYLERQMSVDGVVNNRKKRVLIVEDNPTVAKFYQAAINSWKLPIDVALAEDGFTGLVEIGRQAPHLLISDIYMPGMDGLQMIRSLYKSEQLSGDRIIVISGLSNDNIAERGGIPTDVTFFTKPVDIEGLKQIITQKLQLI
jgi:excisionase family DNA binding protein